MHGRAGELAGGFVSVDNDLEQEFESRLLETSTLAFRVAFSVLRHREDAEDVAQEAFAKAHRHFWRLRDRGRFRAWLVRVTWRMALDRQRANRRRVARELRAEKPSAPTAAGTMLATERSTQLWDAIDALPEKLRVVIILANIEERGLREVAALLGVPEGTVKSRLFLARQRLREQLQ